MIGIISDIHGNYEALKIVLEYFDKNDIKEIYCLGDIVGYFTQINDCCSALRERNIKSVMGNHDWYMATNTNCPRSKSVNQILEYQRKIIKKENLDWLKKLPIYYIKENMIMLHGGINNPIDEYLSPTEEYFNCVNFDIFFSGHTHIQSKICYNNIIYCNPGSIGQPRDSDNRCAFATIDKNKNINLYRLNYDIEKVCYLMEKAGFNGYYYEGLYIGAKNLGYINKEML